MSQEILEKILKNTEIIISLVGRSVFDEEKIRELVTKNKENPLNYIKGYNACDGTRTITEIAKIVNVKRQTMSVALSGWEEQGIVFKKEKPTGTFYKKLFPI